VPKTRGWDKVTNRQSKLSKRQAEVYVFALLAHTDQQTLDPLDLSQWEFYVVKTSEIDRIFGERSSIGINRVKTLSEAYSVNSLMDAVEATFCC